MGKLFILYLAAMLGFAPVNCADAFPQAEQIRSAFQQLGWTQEDVDLSRERFSVGFPVSRNLGTFRNGLFRVEVATFGSSEDRTQSIGLDFLFWTRPASDGFDDDLAAAEALMRELDIPPEAATVALNLLRTSSTNLTPVDGRMPDRPNVHRTAGLVLHTRGEFSQGPGGKSGHLLIQFTRADAPQIAGPTVEDVQSLQPGGRALISYGNADVPLILRPNVAGLSCRSVRADEWLCDYNTTGDDWTGPGRPNTRYSDRFRRNSAGEWMMVSDQVEKD